MRKVATCLTCIALGGALGRGLGYFMAEHYWHNDGKTRAITYFYFDSIGLAGGVIVGLLILVVGLLQNMPAAKLPAQENDRDFPKSS